MLKKVSRSRTNVESGISSAGIAPPGTLSETRVLSMEDAVMASKDSSRSSSRSKSKVKEDMIAIAAEFTVEST